MKRHKGLLARRLRSSQRAARGGSCPRRLRLEPLEQRSLLSITIAGLVTLTGPQGTMIVRDAAVKIDAMLPGGSVEHLSGDTDQTGRYTITDPGLSDADMADALGFDAQVDAASSKVPYRVVPFPAAGPNPGAYARQFADVDPARTGAGQYQLNLAVTGGGPMLGAFEVYTVMYTYYDFAASYLAAPPNRTLLVGYPAPTDAGRYLRGNPAQMWIDPQWVDYPDEIGHEFGHYVADLGGFLSQYAAQHSPGYNGRYYNPAHLGSGNLVPLSASSIGAAFNEGWADYFCTAANYVEGAAGGLNNLGTPGNEEKAYGTQSEFWGWAGNAGSPEGPDPVPGWFLNQPDQEKRVGRGEDEEMSIARILWGLATNPNYGLAESSTCRGDLALYQALCSGFFPTLGQLGSGQGPVTTLAALWNDLPLATLSLGTPGANQGPTINAFAGLFQSNHVSPLADSFGPKLSTQSDTAGQRVFGIEVPVLAADGSQLYSADQLLTFNQVTLQFYASPGDAINTGARVTLDLVDHTPGGQGDYAVAHDTETNPGPTTYYDHWAYTISTQDWNNILSALATEPGWTGGPGQKIYWSAGGVFHGTGGQSQEDSIQTGPYWSTSKAFTLSPKMTPKKFRSGMTTSTNDPQLVYDIVVPPGEDSATIPGFTVSVYASATGVLGGVTEPAGAYYVGDPQYRNGAFAVGATDANGEDCLTATPDDYERTVTLPASALSPTELFCPNGDDITDIYLLADIHFDGDTSSAGDIWIRFEGGAFQTSDGTVWALGSASLDDTTPDGNDPNTITISGGQDALTASGSGGPEWDPISYDETFASAASVAVAGHEGDDTIDGSGMTSAIHLCATAGGGSNLVRCSGGADSESWATLGDGDNTVYCSSARYATSYVSLGDGDNTVYGGAATSYIGAGNGDNTFYLGAAAIDGAFAGCGNNTFIVSADAAGYTEIGGDVDSNTLELKYTTSSPPANLSSMTLPDGYTRLPSGRNVDYVGMAQLGFDFESGNTVDMPLVPAGTSVTVGSSTTLDLGGHSFTLGTVTLDGGTIRNGTITADAYNFKAGTVRASLGGDGGVTVGSGVTGTVTLSGTNNYGGGTWIEGGTLVLGSSGALPSGGDVWLSSPSPPAPLPEGEGSPTLDLGGHSFNVGTVELGGGTIKNGSLSAAAYWLQSGTISANLGGSGGMTVDGGPGDVVVLSGQNSGYSGSIELDGGAVDFVLGGLGSGQIDFQGGTLQWAAGANGQDVSARFDAIAAGQSAILDVNGNQVPAANAISGDGGLVVEDSAGGGVLTLTAANTYSGATDVQQDTLAIGPGGSLGDTAISVATGASFAPAAGTAAGDAADGTAGATLNLQNGSTLDLADGALGNFSLSQEGSFGSGTALTLGGAALDFDLAAAGADELVVNVGSASVSGTNTINISPADGTTSLTPGTYTLVNVAGGGLSGGSFTLGNSTITVGGATYYLSLGGSDTELTLTVDAPPQVVGVYVSGSTWSPAYLSALAAAGVGDATLGFRLADGTGQLANANIPGSVDANQVTIVFSKPVNVASASLGLEDSSSNGGIASGITVVGPPVMSDNNTVATWTLSGPLTSNKYYLELAAAGVTDAAGTELDGDWTTGVSTYAAGSGNGVPGGNFNFEFYVLAGDVNHDGKVTIADFNAIRYNSSLTVDATNWQYDVNGDGKITIADANASRSVSGYTVYSFPEPLPPS